MNILIPIILTVINTILCWAVWHRLGKQSVINDLMRYYDTACKLTEQQHRLIELLKRENAELKIENNELKKNNKQLNKQATMTREELQLKLDALQEAQTKEARRHIEAEAQAKQDYTYAMGIIAMRLQAEKSKEAARHKTANMAIEYERQQLFADYQAAKAQADQQASKEGGGR